MLLSIVSDKLGSSREINRSLSYSKKYLYSIVLTLGSISPISNSGFIASGTEMIFSSVFISMFFANKEGIISEGHLPHH